MATRNSISILEVTNMCLHKDLTTIIWKHHPYEVNVCKTEIMDLLKEYGPKTALDVGKALTDYSQNTIKVELYHLVSDNMIHSGNNRNRFYACLEDKIPMTIPEMKQGSLCRKILDLIENRNMHEEEIVGNFPDIKSKTVKHALYRLRGKAPGYITRVIRTADFIYKLSR